MNRLGIENIRVTLISVMSIFVGIKLETVNLLLGILIGVLTVIYLAMGLVLRYRKLKKQDKCDN